MEQIDKLERFFELDLKAKNIIENARPNLYDIDPVIEEKKMINAIDQIKVVMNEMLSYFYGMYKEKINNKLDSIKESIEKCNLRADELLKAYESFFLIMNKDLEDLMQESSIAYTMKSDQPKVIEKCKSVNELLHSIHFFVINDENIMHTMNIIDSKITDKNKKVTLYGKENDIARDIFKEYDDEVSDYTDIIAFKDHTLMMVRDRGHALTMDITEEGENVRVSYLIPKINNKEMVNILPGVNKVSDDVSTFDQTKGEFVVKNNQIGSVISSFISMVPTDTDNIDIASRINTSRVNNN